MTSRASYTVNDKTENLVLSPLPDHIMTCKWWCHIIFNIGYQTSPHSATPLEVWVSFMKFILQEENPTDFCMTGSLDPIFKLATNSTVASRLSNGI